MKGFCYDPQFLRNGCISLDGKWSFFLIDEKGNVSSLGEIEVPYPPESERSGIGRRDFIKACSYSRKFCVDKLREGERLTINFGAVDYSAEVYVNGVKVGRHDGGYTPFSFEISELVVPGENELEVRVEDDVLSNAPSGKQSTRRDSYGCFYTRVTGIWQSVWLETTPAAGYIKSVRYYPDIKSGAVRIEASVYGKGEFSAEVLYDGKTVGRGEVSASHKAELTVTLDELHLWGPGEGKLYDVVLRFCGDEVKSYFGMREVGYDGKRFTVNGKPVFQRFILDQGYYPDGVYTAESETFARDIKLVRGLGFNGMRLHQKIFHPAYLYECDRAGMMVWGEFPNWGMKFSDLGGLGRFLHEWYEALERDVNRPCIVTWCPLNEVWSDLDDPDAPGDLRFIETVASFTKLYDPTRPVIDASGGMHTPLSDCMDYHCYLTDKAYDDCMDSALAGRPLNDYILCGDENALDPDKPVALSEFGGMSICPGGSGVGITRVVRSETPWGYTVTGDEEKFVCTFERLTGKALASGMSGFCYTQLYDVEQESNGLYRYDRSPKLSPELYARIRKAVTAPAKVEE